MWDSNTEAMVWKNGEPLQVNLSFSFKLFSFIPIDLAETVEVIYSLVSH